MYELQDILELINENSIVIIYNEHQLRCGVYDGKECIPIEYDYCEVNDIFSDNWKLKSGETVSAIGIEINTEDGASV